MSASIPLVKDDKLSKEVRRVLISLGAAAASSLLTYIIASGRKEPEVKPVPKPVKKDDREFNQSLRIQFIEEMDRENNLLVQELYYLDSPSCPVLRVPHMLHFLPDKNFPIIVSPLSGDSRFRSIYGGEGFLPDESFISPGSYTLSMASFYPKEPREKALSLLKAGPRKHLYFRPEEVKAAIATCGGLCPGLNVVIRELYMSLYYNYRVKDVYGIRYGYKGFYSYEWMKLTTDKVRDIHHLGGTILGSSRGGFNLDKIIEALVSKGVTHVYLIGGDGTHRGIEVLSQEIRRRGLRIAICGIPKTIDNDIALIDKSFGFETAVEEAQRSIACARTESLSAENGVGLVKLMGRNAGFIAMHACSASRDVNVCLVPEFQFDVNGPNGLFEYIHQRLKRKGHCTVVVAEGAADGMRDVKLTSNVRDPSGNLKPADIGVYLRDGIAAYCKSKGMEINLKYLDPTYNLRALPANSYDRQMCAQLTQYAVHGLFAGFTGFSIGLINGRTVMLPLSEITRELRKISKSSRPWQRLLASTGQPSFLNDENHYAGLEH
eukprot:TRINITY_DN1581_c0_g1_i4.p1 TRINITY_DN1581_c0_g1~~TRINITY_DN1581_c0_g1_i4.p1  ORF type:complete len:548 (+),score=142.06 TRINITY_DN1581_c0_g1_i4:84-1727(+)